MPVDTLTIPWHGVGVLAADAAWGLNLYVQKLYLPHSCSTDVDTADEELPTYISVVVLKVTLPLCFQANIIRAPVLDRCV